MSARKIGMLLLLLAFGATVETAWQVRGNVGIGPEGCRVMGGRFYGPSYTFEQTADRAVGAGARLEVRNAFGEVRVAAGAPGTVRVKLRKIVFLPTEDKAKAFADRVELRLSGDGSSVTVGTNRDEVGRGQDTGLETHLEIEAPPDTAVSVRNEHGRVDLSGLASADVDSSFDGVSVSRIAGDARVETRHGDVSVSDVSGSATVSARQGGVELAGVRGRVKLQVEHGDTTARRTGAIEAEQQFGSFKAESVAGDLVVRGAHSEVEIADVTGHAGVETSFGGVQLARIGGGARAKVEHGRVEAVDVAGGLVAMTSHDGVTLHRVDGAVEIETQNGAVDADGLSGGARVRASGGDVDLDGFSGRGRRRGRARQRAALPARRHRRADHGQRAQRQREPPCARRQPRHRRRRVAPRRGALRGRGAHGARRGAPRSRPSGDGRDRRRRPDGEVARRRRRRVRRARRRLLDRRSPGGEAVDSVDDADAGSGSVACSLRDGRASRARPRRERRRRPRRQSLRPRRRSPSHRRPIGHNVDVLGRALSRGPPECFWLLPPARAFL